MRTMILTLAAALTALAIVGAAGPSEAGNSQRDCWSWYHDAWAKMQNGNHKGYENSMRKYNNCMNQAWEGPVPKKKKHNM